MSRNKSISEFDTRFLDFLYSPDNQWEEWSAPVIIKNLNYDMKKDRRRVYKSLNKLAEMKIIQRKQKGRRIFFQALSPYIWEIALIIDRVRLRNISRSLQTLYRLMQSGEFHGTPEEFAFLEREIFDWEMAIIVEDEFAIFEKFIEYNPRLEIMYGTESFPIDFSPVDLLNEEIRTSLYREHLNMPESKYSLIHHIRLKMDNE